MYDYRIFFWLALFFILFFPLPNLAQEGAGVTLTPHIIDATAKARDILDYSVAVKNNTGHKVAIYPVVNDLSVTEGKQEFIDPNLLDKAASLARWIEFQRGVIELMPGEERAVPLAINVNLAATPGQRHAVITFPEGNNRTLAEENMRTIIYPQLLINVTVEENVVEKAQVNSFRSDKNIYLGFPVNFLAQMTNSGNREITPAGSVYIYNRRGEEIEKLALNAAGEKVGVGASGSFTVKWSGGGFGKFKARLEVEYGEENKRGLNDTVYFWILPWKLLIIFSSGLVLVMALLALLIYRQSYRHHRPHQAVARPGIVDLRLKK